MENTHSPQSPLDRQIISSLNFGRSDYETLLLVGSLAASQGLSPTGTWEYIKALKAEIGME